MCIRDSPFAGPGSVYIKNLLCFGFEALVDISITHSKACTKKTGALRKTGINRAKQEIRQDTLSKRQETFFRSSGQVGGGVVWRLEFQSACSPGYVLQLREKPPDVCAISCSTMAATH